MMAEKKHLYVPAVVVFAALGLFLYAYQNNGTKVEIRDEPPWFFPAVLEINPGTTVTWELKAATVHPVMTVEAPADTKAIHSGHFTKSWSYTFEKPGLYIYICPIHPYMKGLIGVGEKVPEEKIPSWVNWPPPDESPPSGTPATPGEGRVWVNAQFHQTNTKEKPGTVIIINTRTWEIEKVLDDKHLNNPHNLWEVGESVATANWFGNSITVFDTLTGAFKKDVWVGNSPAHIHGHSKDKTYVTIQGDDGMAILNENFDIVEKIRTSKGPHGHWVSKNGKVMSVAYTEKGSMGVWDMATDKLLFESSLGGETVTHDGYSHTHTLPLSAAVTLDGAYAFTATNGTGKFYVFNVASKKLVKSFNIGAGPVQVIPSPDGKYVVVSLAGEGAAAIVGTNDWSLVKKIPSVGAGAHGVYYGKKSGGGWYAYVSNKFATWVTIIDMDTLEIAGYIPLPKGAWGGQGILITQ